MRLRTLPKNGGDCGSQVSGYLAEALKPTKIGERRVVFRHDEVVAAIARLKGAFDHSVVALD